MIKTSNHDKPFITAELKALDRKKKRIYRKHGKSVAYKEVKSIFDRKYKEVAKKFLQKNVDDLKRTNPRRAHTIIKQLGADADEEDRASFTLKSHMDEDLSVEESVERIAKYFASISQEYPPLNLELMNSSVQIKLENAKSSEVPYISRWRVENILKKTKKKSSTPGDISR